jgi:hypothetical protein
LLLTAKEVEKVVTKEKATAASKSVLLFPSAGGPAPSPPIQKIPLFNGCPNVSFHLNTKICMEDHPTGFI